MCRSRIRFQARPYFLLMSGERSYLLYCLRAMATWSAQYCPSVSLGQPGYEHGRFGLFGMGSPPTESFAQLVLDDVPNLFYIADLAVAHTQALLSGHKKSPHRIAPVKAVLILFVHYNDIIFTYCNTMDITVKQAE